MKSNYNRLDDKSMLVANSPNKVILRIPFGKFAIIVVSLPLFSFIFCVGWCLLYYFDRSTATHCQVFNFLPSISAAIGNYQPQRTVWQLSILIHSIPRFFFCYIYFVFYNKIIRKNRRHLANVTCFLNFIENCALLGLTLWTSVDNYDIHKKSFVTFIITSEIYMLLSYVLNKNCRKEMLLNKIEVISLVFKRRLCITNIISIFLATYFFMRHNTYCEPGVYSFFAFFEYIVVLTNMGFHMTAYWDFYDRFIQFDRNYGLQLR